MFKRFTLDRCVLGLLACLAILLIGLAPVFAKGPGSGGKPVSLDPTIDVTPVLNQEDLAKSTVTVSITNNNPKTPLTECVVVGWIVKNGTVVSSSETQLNSYIFGAAEPTIAAGATFTNTSIPFNLSTVGAVSGDQVAYKVRLTYRDRNKKGVVYEVTSDSVTVP